MLLQELGALLHTVCAKHLMLQCVSHFSSCTGDAGEPAAKKPHNTPKPGPKLQPNLPPKLAAGQNFLRSQLDAMDQRMDSRQAKVSANNMAMAAYKTAVKMYQQKQQLQDKHNDRLMTMYKMQLDDAVRRGKSPPPAPAFDSSTLQEPEMPECMKAALNKPSSSNIAQPTASSAQPADNATEPAASIAQHADNTDGSTTDVVGPTQDDMSGPFDHMSVYIIADRLTLDRVFF